MGVDGTGQDPALKRVLIGLTDPVRHPVHGHAGDPGHRLREPAVREQGARAVIEGPSAGRAPFATADR